MQRILTGTMVTLALLFSVGTAGAAGVSTITGELPVTLEGTLEVDLAPGEIEDNAEGVAYGTLRSEGKEYAVELPAEPYATAPKGGAGRVTLGSVSRDFGFPLYRVTKLELL